MRKRRSSVPVRAPGQARFGACIFECEGCIHAHICASHLLMMFINPSLRFILSDFNACGRSETAPIATACRLAAEATRARTSPSFLDDDENMVAQDLARSPRGGCSSVACTARCMPLSFSEQLHNANHDYYHHCPTKSSHMKKGLPQRALWLHAAGLLTPAQAVAPSMVVATHLRNVELLPSSRQTLRRAHSPIVSSVCKKNIPNGAEMMRACVHMSLKLPQTHISPCAPSCHSRPVRCERPASTGWPVPPQMQTLATTTLLSWILPTMLR